MLEKDYAFTQRQNFVQDCETCCRPMKRYRLDKEEKEILNAIENDQWELVKPKGADLDYYAEIARNAFRKDQRINIRISKADWTRIKAKAAQEGIPYQTLVASVIHKYASGSLLAA